MTQTDKTTIQTLVSRETGEVRSRVVPDATGDNLQQALATHTDPKRTHLPDRLALRRYSTRFLSDTERMRRTLGQAGGRRLTYRETRLV